MATGARRKKLDAYSCSKRRSDRRYHEWLRDGIRENIAKRKKRKP